MNQGGPPSKPDPVTPSFTLAALGNKLGISVPSDAADLSIHGIQSLEEAGPHDLSFLANPKYLPQCRASKAAAILVPSDFKETIQAIPLPTPNPSLLFSMAIECFRPSTPPPTPGIHSSASIDSTAVIGPGVSIGPNVVVEAHAVIGGGSVILANTFIGSHTRLGEHCMLHPNVVVQHHTQIGDRVIIQPGAVIGSDGFGYELVDGAHRKIPQVGIVQIDDDVEIGANCTIDRARFGRTWIQQGAKIDNLVQIAHNVTVGAHAIVVAQVGISGSSKIGRYAVLAGQVGVVGHITIGDQAIVAAQSGVSKDVPSGAAVLGSPAVPIREEKERIARVARLPKWFDRIKALEARLNALESNATGDQSDA